MRKRIILFLLFIFCLLLVGCNSKEACTIECEDVYVVLGESTPLPIICSKSDATFSYSYSEELIEIKNDVVYGKALGESTIIISSTNYDGKKEVRVIVNEPGLKITGNKEVVIEQSVQLDLQRFAVDEDEKIVWKSSNTSIARVSDGLVKGVGLGTVTITAKSDIYSYSFDMEVIRPEITEIITDSSIKLEIDSEYTLEYSVYPNYASEEITIESNNDNLTINSSNNIVVNKTGNTILKVSSKANPNVYKEVNVEILEKASPEFEKSEEYIETLEFDYGETPDILAGLKAIDNADGDITSKITYDETMLLAYGLHDIELTVRDKSGNESTFNRSVKVNWPYNVKFIGHSGCYYGVPNTEEAFLYAASVLHYQAIECDLHLTKDGVFVTNHDSYLSIKDSSGNVVEKVVITETNYADLIKYEITSGKYTGHVCTLQRYLEICKKYGCEAIIELKSTTGISDYSQENVPKLLNYIKSFGMWENTILLTYNTTIMSYIRGKKYDIRMQYLVQLANLDSVYNYCVKNNVDVSVNVTYSTTGENGEGINDEWIKKYHDAGVKISTWTFSGKYEQVQKWIDKGVDYVTCDIHYMDKLTLK